MAQPNPVSVRFATCAEGRPRVWDPSSRSRSVEERHAGHASTAVVQWAGEDYGDGDGVSLGGRAEARGRTLRRAALVAGVLVLVAVVLLAGGHWVLGAIAAAVAAGAVWLFLQVRTVR